MPSQYKRRTILTMVESSVVLTLAGCASNPNNDDSNESPNQAQESIMMDNLTWDVTVEEGFSDTHPAQIHASLTNTLETPVTLSTGITPPFTSYLSDGESDENQLILVPDVPEDESPLDWIGEQDPIPTSPENGCWNVTQDVQIEEPAMESELDVGDTSNQQYDVYGYQNESCPSSSEYQFKDSVRFYRGQPTDDSTEYTAKLGFTVILDDNQSISVKTDEPPIKTTEN
jgi:hypothetical protein